MRVHLNVVQGRDAPRTLELEAGSLDEARQQAMRQGYVVLSLHPVRADLATLLGARAARPARFDLVVFIEQLRDLLGAGLSAIEALQPLQQAADARSRPVLDALIRRLRGGESLSQALLAEACFPPLLVALVRAAELTSELPQALTRFLEHEQRMAEVRHRLTSVAVYPLLLAGVGMAVLLFLLLYVMPRFARIFEGMSGELPGTARAMIAWSQWLGTPGPWLLAGGVLLSVALGVLAGAQGWRERATRRLLRWAPLRTYFLARWYRATGLLMQGGIPLPEALQQASGLLPAGLRAGGLAVENALREGHSPAQAHARAGMATPVAEQLMHAGERTGDLGSVLARIAQFHETEVTRAIERGMRLFEPVVMVLIGLGVGGVVVLMYLPIFELAAAIQ